MPNEALYVYGLVKFGLDLDWKEIGIDGANVYSISEGKFSALIHNCEEKPYNSKEPEKVKEWIVVHNRILDKAMKDFWGVIPLHFNTIIKKGEKTAEYNLKVWLSNETEVLEKMWNKIKGKKEYGVRIYYEKAKLLQKIASNKEVKQIESQEGKGKGLNYLLQEKAKDKVNKVAQIKINQLKHVLFKKVKKITKDVKINTSKIFIDEEKDLLLSLSILTNEQQITKIKHDLRKNMGEDFSFNFAGPFPPYSFVENEI